MHPIQTLSSSLCYKRPWPAFAEQSEDRACYNPYVDTYFKPVSSDSEDQALSDICEISHRALTCARSKCEMRFIASSIHQRIFELILVKSRKEWKWMLEWIHCMHVLLWAIHFSTLYVEELYSLLRCIGHFKDPRAAVRIKNIDAKEKEALFFLQDIEGLRGFARFYHRLATVCTKTGMALAHLLAFHALNTPSPPIEELSADDSYFGFLGNLVSEDQNFSPNLRLYRSLFLVENLFERVNASLISRLSTNGLRSLLETVIPHLDPMCAGGYCLWDDGFHSGDAQQVKDMRELSKYVCDAQLKLTKALPEYMVGVDREVVAAEFYTPLVLFRPPAHITIKPLTAYKTYKKGTLLLMLFFESLRQQIHMQEGVICPFERPDSCTQCESLKGHPLKEYLAKFWEHTKDAIVAKHWQEPKCLRK